MIARPVYSLLWHMLWVLSIMVGSLLYQIDARYLILHIDLISLLLYTFYTTHINFSRLLVAKELFMPKAVFS